MEPCNVFFVQTHRLDIDKDWTNMFELVGQFKTLSFE